MNATAEESRTASTIGRLQRRVADLQAELTISRRANDEMRLDRERLELELGARQRACEACVKAQRFER